MFNSNVISISEKSVVLSINDGYQNLELKNDLVFIFAGGELPTKFLEKAGIQITTKHGEAILEHKK
jgi:thioredoxin reductase